MNWRLTVNKAYYIQDFKLSPGIPLPCVHVILAFDALLILTGVLDSAGTFIDSGRIDVNWDNGYRRHFEMSTTLCSIGSAKLLYYLL